MGYSPQPITQSRTAHAMSKVEASKVEAMGYRTTTRTGQCRGNSYASPARTFNERGYEKFKAALKSLGSH
eukprot:scaffold462614_cov25-Prasinocladus_malaysianus.AAC.1